MNATAVGPDLVPKSISMRQQAPGRYIGEFTPEEAGSYMLSIVPGSDRQIFTTGVNVPFSDEYRIRQANMRLIEQLANSTPLGGQTGKVLPELNDTDMEELLRFDTYRPGLPPARSLKDIWPLVVLLGASLFLADVFIRRVAVDFGWPLRKLAAFMSQMKTSEVDLARQKSLERLRSSKSQVSHDLEKQRSSTSMELPDPLESNPNPSSSDTFGTAAFKPAESKSTGSAPSDSLPKSKSNSDNEDYTSRLLEAKRKAKKNQN
jgi:hypothetical protein